MKKTTKKNNESKKILIIALTILLVIVLIGGATFAYLSWESATNQKTTISGRVPNIGEDLDGDGEPDGFIFNITGGGVSTTANMYPTKNCSGNAALISDVTTVTVKNPTSTDMTAFLAIRATLTASQGSLTSTNKGYLKWAIVDTSTAATCSSPTASGTLANATTNTDIDTTIRFTATKEATTTKTYKLYVWLDNNYSHKNVGNVISDPMQNLNIKVQWSPDSTLAQSPTFTFTP